MRGLQAPLAFMSEYMVVDMELSQSRPIAAYEAMTRCFDLAPSLRSVKVTFILKHISGMIA